MRIGFSFFFLSWNCSLGNLQHRPLFPSASDELVEADGLTKLRNFNNLLDSRGPSLLETPLKIFICEFTKVWVNMMDVPARDFTHHTHATELNWLCCKILTFKEVMVLQLCLKCSHCEHRQVPGGTILFYYHSYGTVKSEECELWGRSDWNLYRYYKTKKQ